MRAGGLAADQETVGAELALRVLHEPERRRLAVVGTGRIRVLGREPIVDAHHREPALVGDALVGDVGVVRRAERPAAAVEVQVDTARRRRRDHADRDLAGGPRDLADTRRIDGEHGPPDAFAALAFGANLGRTPQMHRRRLGEHLLDGLVELRGDGIDGTAREGARIESR